MEEKIITEILNFNLSGDQTVFIPQKIQEELDNGCIVKNINFAPYYGGCSQPIGQVVTVVLEKRL